ncbi:MAG TPA: hypothetical protein DD730_03355 [Desulfosporosinus sp.]|jgi:hypothetical protein|nr:hypothetical protein [Desulfosporosinus sp.]
MQNAVQENRAASVRDLQDCQETPHVPITLYFRGKHPRMIYLPSAESMRHFLEAANAYQVKKSL